MSLWPRHKPLNQPPHRGRIGITTPARPEHAEALHKAASRVISDAQFDRDQAARRFGGRRAVVRG